MLPLALFLGSVLAMKLAVMLQLKDHILTQPDAGLDTTAYVTLALRVVAGDLGLGPALYFVSPFYIYFLATIVGVTHSFTAARAVQIVFGTAAVALVFVAANEWYGRRAAWLAAAMAALTGLFTFYESLLLQAALDPFLTAAVVAFTALSLTRTSPGWAAAAGAAYGVQICNRPNVAIPAAGIALLLAANRQWRLATALALGVALALTPTTIRNIVVSHYWSPLTASHGGLNFYVGNNPDADGTYAPVAGISANMLGQQEGTRRVAEQATGRALDDGAVSMYFYRLAWMWMREHPAAAARLLAKKMGLMFSAGYIWLNYSYPFFSRDAQTLLRLLIVGPWILIPLGLVGLVAAVPGTRRREYLVWASFVPLYGAAVAIFYVTDRYQLPVLVPLAAGAGAALDVFAQQMASKCWRSLGAAVTALVVLFLWANRPLRLDDGVAEERIRMAERLVTLGRYGEAEEWVTRAKRAHPYPGAVDFRIAQRLLAQDQTRAAIAHFEEALTLDPSQAVAEYALGEAYLEAKRASDAVPHLRRALAAGVRADQAGYDLVRALGATGDRAAAIQVLSTLHPNRDDDAARWTALADLALQLQEPGTAEAFARKAIAARPEEAAGHADLGFALNLERRWIDAARELAVAIRLNPNDARPHIGLAVAHANSGRIVEARQHVEEALRIDPASTTARKLQEALR
jgi:tetratricopeptide (TPR) repeat protein